MNGKLTCNDIFNKNKIVPVVVLNDINKAISVGKALIDGGINIMEVTLRTPNALQIIETLRKNLPQAIIGAGTVLTDDQYHLAVKHGAQFIVSPGLTNDLAVVSNDYDVPFLPGAITPTEILNAYNHGFDFLKYFPAESYNGLSSLKSLASVFSKIKFCPTGGINLTNAINYLVLPNVVAVGCSFLVTNEFVNNNDFASITKLANEIIIITEHEARK